MRVFKWSTNLLSIAAIVGMPLCLVDLVLVEYDVLWQLLSCIWIGEGTLGFWQVIFEKFATYYSSCKHLGHFINGCFVTDPGL